MTSTTGIKHDSLHHVEDAEKQTRVGKMISEREQHDAAELERKYHIPLQAVLDAHLEEDPKAVLKVMRKVDMRLVPMLSLLYMWAFIDRSNLGNVRMPELIQAINPPAETD